MRNNRQFLGVITKPIISILFVLFFSSCDSNRVYEENMDIPQMAWDKNNKLKFEVDITDTISAYNVFINIRNAGIYQFSNIYLFINITFPNGKIRKDTTQCTLADVQGNWLGSGLGDIWDNKIEYMPNTHFPLSGKYIFEIEQAMRADKLEGILDAGLRIEKLK